ncbi:response regulator [Sulfidibacter corallicola]|uniref:Response regulator n=1 Tax=Sulfidibacter corallicola TaxID=2818388 RepID=A0A8A4TH17_SULCO|nr:response regulator [Sulfidibacter corallicola]QTD49216.1 response regulator [Sulfidibacter corallicola]
MNDRDNSEAGTLVVVAEDEPKIAKVLTDYLSAHGYETHWIENGSEVVDYVRSRNPSLLLLDVMLPGKDGMSICKELRTFTQMPILMLTARVEEVDRILGLELGADDYICKPFSPREVVARVKTVLRRAAPRSEEPEEEKVFAVDEERREIRVKGSLLTLTPNEYTLLRVLIKQPGRVFTRDQLVDNLYDDFRAVTDRTIDSHIKNLRKKITAVMPGTEVIRSVYGVGYKLQL